MLIDRKEAERLVLSLDRLAWKLAHKARARAGFGDPAEYHAEAMAGFWVAATRYSPARGVAFVTYAAWWGRKAVGRLVRREAARGLHVPAHHPLAWVGVTPFGVMEQDAPFDVPAPDRPRAIDPAAFWPAVEAAIPEAGPREAVVRYYRERQADKDIAAACGIARRSATGRRQKGEEYLRAAGADRLAELVG